MKTGDKIRIMTSSEYKKYVASHDVPDLFTGTFAEKYMGKQGLIKETYVGTAGVTWCKVSTGRSTYPWPDYMIIKLSDKMQPRISGRVGPRVGIPEKTLKQMEELKASTLDPYYMIREAINTNGLYVSSDMGKDSDEMVTSKVVLDNPLKYAAELKSRLAAFTDRCPKDKVIYPLELDVNELAYFGLSKTDIILRAISNPSLEVTVTISRKKDVEGI